jgi:hypothetical protein
MPSFEVSPGVAQPKYGFSPSHKITITNDTDIYTYWYVQDPVTSRPFDEMNDHDLVRLMYEKGREYKIGQFESFAIGTERNYHLQRLGSHEFIIKSLR